MSTRNRTAAWLDSPSNWPGVEMILEDIQWLHGGRRIVVCGTGHVGVQIVQPDRHEERYEFKLDKAATHRLIQLFIDNDFMNITCPDRAGIPDEARPTIMIRNADDWLELKSKWAGVKEERFDAIYAELRQLETLAQPLKPVYTGPYASHYWPQKANRSLSRITLNFKKYFQRNWRRLLIKLTPSCLLILFGFSLFLAIAYFWIRVEPGLTYGFGSAILHGWFWAHNWILSWFIDRYIWAPSNSGIGYTLGFIIGVIIPFALSLIGRIIEALWEEITKGSRRGYSR